jgi:hypothetical protein
VDSVDKDYGKFIQPVQKVWRSFEQKNFQDQGLFEEKVLGIYKRNPGKAVQVLTDYTSRKAVEFYREADKMSRKPQ